MVHMYMLVHIMIVCNRNRHIIYSVAYRYIYCTHCDIKLSFKSKPFDLSICNVEFSAGIYTCQFVAANLTLVEGYKRKFIDVWHQCPLIHVLPFNISRISILNILKHAYHKHQVRRYTLNV